MNKEKKINVPMTQNEIDSLYSIVHVFGCQMRHDIMFAILEEKEVSKDEELMEYWYGRLEDVLKPYVKEEEN